jgi:threonine dehydrogenase-like Zn-dependent dehydrogenase
MMQGEFGPLPLNMQGHEGLGRVISVGKNIFTDVVVGDIVATRGEPAYADRYPVREFEFVKVPEAHPRYIVEPVACGINIVLGDLTEIQGRALASDHTKLLIIGSGFLAYVAYCSLLNLEAGIQVDVVGSSNKDIWTREGVDLLSAPEGEYDIVINLKERHSWFEQNIIKENGLLIEAVGRSVSKKESDQLLWRAVTTTRPSPRKQIFSECMEMAVEWIKTDKITVDKFWTRSYNRDTNWRKAFDDGVARPIGYSRGYIYWNK